MNRSEPRKSNWTTNNNVEKFWLGNKIVYHRINQINKRMTRTVCECKNLQGLIRSENASDWWKQQPIGIGTYQQPGIQPADRRLSHCWWPAQYRVQQWRHMPEMWLEAGRSCENTTPRWTPTRPYPSVSHLPVTWHSLVVKHIVYFLLQIDWEFDSV